MKHIGYVQYKKGENPGTLNATWLDSECGSGTGVAIGEPCDGFSGSYQVQYFDDNEVLVAKRELKIQKSGNRYDLKWLNNGKVTSIGIGMENIVGLSAGYRDV